MAVLYPSGSISRPLDSLKSEKVGLIKKRLEKYENEVLNKIEDQDLTQVIKIIN